ncbi:MAG: hypothetical protein GY856_22485 [bacterium]|nr:hypothetical protein [bacterium]
MDNDGWTAASAQLLSRARHGRGDAKERQRDGNEQVTTISPREQGRRPRRGQLPDGQRMGAHAALG